jgi:hypothetical protein
VDRSEHPPKQLSQRISTLNGMHIHDIEKPPRLAVTVESFSIFLTGKTFPPSQSRERGKRLRSPSTTMAEALISAAFIAYCSPSPDLIKSAFIPSAVNSGAIAAIIKIFLIFLSFSQ